jgi:hypothetical protein
MFKVWIARKKDNKYKVASEVAEIVAEELSESLDDKTCAFCSNKAQSAAVVV